MLVAARSSATSARKSSGNHRSPPNAMHLWEADARGETQIRTECFPSLRTAKMSCLDLFLSLRSVATWLFRVSPKKVVLRRASSPKCYSDLTRGWLGWLLEEPAGGTWKSQAAEEPETENRTKTETETETEKQVEASLAAKWVESSF